MFLRDQVSFRSQKIQVPSSVARVGMVLFCALSYREALGCLVSGGKEGRGLELPGLGSFELRLRTGQELSGSR